MGAMFLQTWSSTAPCLQTAEPQTIKKSRHNQIISLRESISILNLHLLTTEYHNRIFIFTTILTVCDIVILIDTNKSDKC